MDIVEVSVHYNTHVSVPVRIQVTDYGSTPVTKMRAGGLHQNLVATTMSLLQLMSRTSLHAPYFTVCSITKKFCCGAAKVWWEPARPHCQFILFDDLQQVQIAAHICPQK